MPQYEVTLKNIEIYTLTVDAESENEAIGTGWDMLDENKNKYHNDSDFEESAFEVTD